ncbi:MAG: hypothetical protein K1X88_34110 [Nannocystaceae bacterium]|nr:hypothetical protein [Nannocystaceae bacterium]
MSTATLALAFALRLAPSQPSEPAAREPIASEPTASEPAAREPASREPTASEPAPSKLPRADPPPSVEPPEPTVDPGPAPPPAEPPDAPPIERADTGPIEVAAIDCPGLDAREVGRLLAIDLAAVTQEVRRGPPLGIEIRCRAPTLVIAIADPITRKRLERQVPLPRNEPGRERVVALAISQLFAASWLELLLPPPPGPPPLPPTPTPSAAAIEAAGGYVRRRVDARPRALGLVVGATVRGRALERTPLPSFGGELDVRGWFGDAAVLGRIGVEGGVARREAGRVRAWQLALGLGTAGRVRVAPRWALGGTIVVQGALARLRGAADAGGIATGATTAVSGQALLGGGPRLSIGAGWIELDAEVGLGLRAPVGLVEGDRAVSLGGVLAGGALRLGYERKLVRRR